jgi:flagellar basal-body rod protein FlgC
LGAYKVKVSGVRTDNTDFVKKYDPSNPVADAQGYVQMPNVNPLVETMDMSEASRSYQANLDVISASRTMILKTIGLLQ